MIERSDHTYLFKLSILPTIIAIGAISYTYILQTPTPPSRLDFFSVVFDAGSTGSRVSVFHFVKLRVKDDTFRVVLEKEVFHSVEPGISSYAKKPSEAGDSLTPLMNTAIKTVSQNFQSDTVVNFKATAGLRLLPKEKADAILQEVKLFLTKSPFLIANQDKIMIMSETEEGLFAWVSVNFLLDLIWDEQIDNSVTTFDLGGGSTQVTFEIYENEFLKTLNSDDLYEISFGAGPKFIVFTKSYLGYGLKSARLGILGGKEEPNGKITYDPILTKVLPSGEFHITTSCLHLEQKYNLSHGDQNYLVIGTNENQNVLTECQKVVHRFVEAADFVQSKELSRRDINLFSYFFDVARWAKLIPWKDNHEVLRVEDYYIAAQKYCHAEKMSSKHPFLCIDLLYIHSLLTIGIGLSPDKLLHVETKIKGKEVSWSIGAALSNEFNYTRIKL
ncbi:Ectonucleoside triphosphate diphosphohydrolase 5 [Bulinus truncatus]|nr:Ectonucleoside triphosphate diphosphohydrolase 5 [Bulinus truncatus]